MSDQTVHAIRLGSDTTDAQAQTDSEIITALNEAIAMCRNAESGYLLAAQSSKDAMLQETFTHYAQQRHRFGDALVAAVVALGARPERQGDLAGFLHRMWIRLRQFLGNAERDLLLEDCLVGEAAAITVYEELLSLRLPGHVQGIVERQYGAIRAARARLDALHDGTER